MPSNDDEKIIKKIIFHAWRIGAIEILDHLIAEGFISKDYENLARNLVIKLINIKNIDD